MEEQQICFPTDDGFMVCNFVVKNGIIIRSKTGKMLRFPMSRRKNIKEETARV